MISASVSHLQGHASVLMPRGETAHSPQFHGNTEYQFKAMLKNQMLQADRPDDSRRDEVRDAATKLVASALVVPALSSLHQSPLRPATGPFAANAAEKRFAPLLDSLYADRITEAGNFGIVDRIVDRFASRMAASRTTPSASSPEP